MLIPICILLFELAKLNFLHEEVCVSWVLNCFSSSQAELLSSSVKGESVLWLPAFTEWKVLFSFFLLPSLSPHLPPLPYPIFLLFFFSCCFLFCFVLGLPSVKYCPSYPTVFLEDSSVLSRFSSVQLFVTPRTVASQVPLSMAFSMQEHWSGLPFPTPENLPDLGIEPRSPVFPAFQADSLPTEPLRKSWLSQGRAEAHLIHHCHLWLILVWQLLRL